MASEKNRLFAVIIGINSYKTTYSDLRPLRGAVSDASDFKTYLQDYLEVPTNQIVFLTDENATRSNIIDALKGLREDKRIAKDDAIFVYFAGHGTEIDPPTDRKNGTQKIQAIIPNDCDVIDRSGKRVPPIPDYVLGLLLSKIAETKGNNITVVFDCCHSASGTRSAGSNTDVITRSVELPSNDYSEQLVPEIWELETVTRGSYVLPKFRERGLSSHILLSACGVMEKAQERGGRGLFSAALLKMLIQVWPVMPQYSDLLRHPSLDRIDGQNPQCEGLHVNRTLFNSKVLPAQRKSFSIFFDAAKNNGLGQYVVRGGTIHNITLDSEFEVYRKTDIKFSTPIAVLYVAELQSFSFIAKLPPNVPSLDVADPLIVVQTKFGEQSHLRIHSPLEDGFRKIYDDILVNSDLKHHFNGISLVDESKGAQVEVTLAANDKVRFTMHNEVPAPHQMTATQVVDDVEADPYGLAWTFSKIAHFYRELKYINNDPRISRSVDVELYQLTEEYKVNEDTGFEEDFLEKTGPNLCTNGVVDLSIPNAEAEEIPYGIRIVNKSSVGLYANVFHFSSNDLSIVSCATSHNGHTDYGLDIPLKRQGGSLEIGFGTAGYCPISFQIANGLDVDVGFLKIYLSTQSNVNLAYLAQSSPFFPTRGLKVLQDVKPKRGPTWTDIVIPIILRRHQTGFADLKRN